MDGQTRATSNPYSGEAARLATTALRADEPVAAGSALRPAIPTIHLDEPHRPSLAPRSADNQNRHRRDRHRPRLARLIARIVIAPWYVAVAIASVGLDGLFIKDMLGF